MISTQKQIPAHHPAGLLGPLKDQFSQLFYHLYTVYLFTRDNLKEIVGLGLLFGVLNASVAPKFSMGPALPLKSILLSSHKMLLWSWSNLFLFNLHNQRHPSSITEDALNKPWRPLPAGRITPKQTTRIMYMMYPVVIMVSLVVGGQIPCFMGVLFYIWYNELGGAANPFYKNLLNGLGLASSFSGPLEVATGHSLAILAAGVTTMIHLQDFRNMDGDKAAGRDTVPLVVGDKNARVIVLLRNAGWLEGSMAWVAGVIMVGNLFYDQTREGDSFSWKLFPVWFVGLFLLPLLVE
ncbi:hypothetical protein F4677DRAFT_453652 [Hypoxylon crocopeplum]|nr:hypothetical protein F4677DRAFT_453652 [Hypoxylon crocopeplum]